MKLPWQNTRAKLDLLHEAKAAGGFPLPVMSIPPAGKATLDVPIPPDPSLLGVPIHLQAGFATSFSLRLSNATVDRVIR